VSRCSKNGAGRGLLGASRPGPNPLAGTPAGVLFWSLLRSPAPYYPSQLKPAPRHCFAAGEKYGSKLKDGVTTWQKQASGCRDVATSPAWRAGAGPPHSPPLGPCRRSARCRGVALPLRMCLRLLGGSRVAWTALKFGVMSPTVADATRPDPASLQAATQIKKLAAAGKLIKVKSSYKLVGAAAAAPRFPQRRPGQRGRGCVLAPGSHGAAPPLPPSGPPPRPLLRPLPPSPPSRCPLGGLASLPPSCLARTVECWQANSGAGSG
jgi:hypothetical protein